VSGADVLDATSVADWLSGLTRSVSTGVTGTAREQIVSELRTAVGAPRAPFPGLAALALVDDCLRVAHLAIEADGVVDDEELARIRPLAQIAAPRFFSILHQYVAFGESELSDAELIEFLRTHREHRTEGAWWGLQLCKRVAAHTQNDGLTRDHERMLVRVMDAVFAGRDSATERAARDKLRGLFEVRSTGGIDPRAAAFCRHDGPEVFSSVAHGSQIFERDPFDVETIHAEARAVFHRQIEHAITPSHHDAGHGRTLLVLGTAGSGKTHLLRAFRNAVHEERLGYVGYLQMSSDVGDYSRYVLTKLVDSFERPYYAPDLNESALLYLSNGLAEHHGIITAAELEQLRTAELDPDRLPAFIGGMVDRLVRTEELAEVDSDLLQALLLLQRRDPALQRRIVKFLRCESLTSYEQGLLGGLAPRLNAEDPERMIVQLGRLAYELHQAAFVLLVDQIEDAIPDAKGHERVRRAIDAVRRVADALPSAVVVIACLDDVYVQIQPHLSQSVIDRLERDPAPARLTGQRSRDEIEAMLVRRLEHLYDAMDVAWRDDDPMFPFEAEQIDKLTNQRARDCLAFFRKYQEQCIAGHGIVPPGLPPPVRTPTQISLNIDDLERAWNDALVSVSAAPEEDEALLRLVEAGARACAEELGLEAQITFDARREALMLSLPGKKTRVAEFCNRQAQGGHLGKQIEALRKGLTADQVAVALRTSEFSFGPRTAVARAIGEMVAAGGLALPVEDGDLRAVAAYAAFATAHGRRPDFGDWRRKARPLAGLALFRKLLDLDSAPRRASTASDWPPAPAEPAPAMIVDPPRVEPPKPKSPVRANQLRLGTTPTMRSEPVALDVQAFKVHAAFLGTTGSGKTTIALNIIEQLLARGVSALMVDRKGDLARYASEEWWDEVPADPEVAARKRDLRARVVVDLYTPGESSGRPLRIPMVPAGMDEMTTQERDQMAKAAASGLAAMIGYGKGESQRRREAILKKAIELHADTQGASLDDLLGTISRPDPELLAAVGNLTRHFANVSEDLQMLKIQRGNLLSGDGDVLDVGAMLAPRDGRARLAIVSAVALTDTSVLQFFVSRLLVELGRMVRRNPQPELRTVAFFDEADMYIPAVSSPPTKEPMFELLRRARSGGLGVMLATQNPGDLDYKARDNIATWLVGRVAQDRAIEKMKNLLANYPNVATRLASQATGSFFLLNSQLVPPARELRADASLMTTAQLQEHEIAGLARDTARRT
jgi:energy-coupling factor transporter ATP-binding protein EcfA2